MAAPQAKKSRGINWGQVAIILVVVAIILTQCSMCGHPLAEYVFGAHGVHPPPCNPFGP